MELQQAKARLQQILLEIRKADGSAAVERYASLRHVDAKTREVKLIIQGLPTIPPSLIADMEANDDFEAMSRRVRLEALSNYCDTALMFLTTGMYESSRKKVLIKAPDVTRLTSSMPNLGDCLSNRWLEAQRCQHAQAYLAAVIIMGSILEALLLARALNSPIEACASSSAPKSKGKAVAVQDWTLHQLVEVAVELKWVKVDRGKFSHALRESRNVVHPWAEAASRTSFDEATCKMCWEVLNASVDDLMASLP